MINEVLLYKIIGTIGSFLLGVIGLVYTILTKRIDKLQSKDVADAQMEKVEICIKNGFGNMDVKLKSISDILDFRLESVEKIINNHITKHT